jgi:hypothetical protein
VSGAFGEAVIQGGVAATGTGDPDGLADRLGGSDEDDEFLRSDDGGVQQVPLQHHPRAGGDRDDNTGYSLPCARCTVTV